MLYKPTQPRPDKHTPQFLVESNVRSYKDTLWGDLLHDTYFSVFKKRKFKILGINIWKWEEVLILKKIDKSIGTMPKYCNGIKELDEYLNLFDSMQVVCANYFSE